MENVESLNAHWALADQLWFEQGAGGLIMARIANAHATATIALQGAQVLAWQPRAEQPVLWLSQRSRYEMGKAIRGGVPVCWPWFGPHPSDPSKPQHGFARTMEWDVQAAEATPDGATLLRLHLRDNTDTHAVWPQRFRLLLTITVGATLTIDLAVQNTDAEPWTWTGALHSYFAVSDVRSISIDGLDGVEYLDKTDDQRRKTQHGSITIAQETDRVYEGTAATCAINDPGWQRRITISKQGSRSTVVWNPWIEKARATPDIGDGAYTQFGCVETAIAGSDQITLQPGATHQLTAIIASEQLL